MKMFRLLIGLALLGASLFAHAASFDCAKAQSKVERWICRVPELSSLDEDVAAMYEAALQVGASADATRLAQTAWLKERDRCADSDCVKRSYDGRKHALSQVVENPVGIQVLYGDWTGMGTASEAIYGLMAISNTKITWKGQSHGAPRCTVTYERISEPYGKQFKDESGKLQTIAAGSPFKTFLLTVRGSGECLGQSSPISQFRFTIFDRTPGVLDLFAYSKGPDDMRAYLSFVRP